MSYTSVFGGTTIYPSDVSYLSLALAADTPLEWPLESSGTLDPAARIIDVTPSAGGYSIDLPDATLTGAGQTILFNNLGVTHSFFVKDFAGNTLATVTPGTQWQVYLAAVTTAAGTWRVFQYGASTATVQPSALAGFGLIADGSQLAQSLPVVTLSTTGTTVSTANRACAFVWTATGAGTLNLLTAAAAGNNFFVFVRNEGGGDLVVEPAGTETINSDANLTLRPGDSATIITDGATWYTIGLGRQAVFAFDYTSIGVTGGNYTLAGAELNRIAYKFVGVLTSDVYIIVPPTVQQYWVNNATTGAFSLFVRTSGGTPELVGPGAKGIYYCDGTDIILGSDPVSIATPIIISDGGTGATTASAARLNLGITLFADAIVTATTGASVRTTIGAAASGANNDITSLTGLTTAISVPQGGTGQTTYTNGQLLIGNTTGNTLDKATLTAGSGVSITNGAGAITIAATGSGGTVTSVGGTGTVNGITLTGTVTTTGNLTLGGALSGVSLATQVTGTLPVGNGGTGATTLTSGYLVKGNGASAASASVVYDDGTNVGIGTTSPGAKLDVIGDINSGPITVRPSGGEGGQISLQDPTGAFPAYNFDVDGAGEGRLFTTVNNTDLLVGQISGTGGQIITYTGGAERMRIDATGNVGIGNTPSGTYKLEVTGATYSSSMVLGAALPVASGGSGQTSYTDGQLLIGNTVGNTLAKATLTAGSNISITNGNGSITITSLAGGGSVTSVSGTGTVNGLTLTGTVTTSGSLTLGGTLSGVSLTTQVTGTLPIANGGTGATTAAAARTALGATTLGANVFTITNPSAITFPRFNADNTVSALDAATFRTAIGAGAGTVTSVGGTGTVNGLTLTGTVTSSGSLTLGGTLSGVSLTTQVSGTLPVASGGTGQTTYTNGQLLIGNTTGNTLAKATLTAGTGIAITNGSGTITIAATGGSGTVTSVSGAGTVNGLTLTGTVTSTGSLTLGGTLSGVSLTTQVSGTLPIANGGTGATTAAASRTALGSTTVGDGVFTAVNAAAGRTALSAAASGANSDITALDQDVTITVTGTIAADTIGFRGIPQNAQTASYTLALSDAGRHISNTTGGFVIPANGTVPFPIGTTIVLFNNSASSQSVTITTDTLRLAGTATTGTRTLAQYGLATCIKVTSTVWVISGAGLT